MKRYLSFVVFAVLVGLCASATDRFYIEDFSIAPGETRTVSILLDNETEYSAFQSDVYLPEGFTATNFALTDRKNSNHTLTATALPDGGIRLLSYSLKLKTYSGNSGALVTFDVTASEDFADPATIHLKNTIFTTAEGIEVALDDEECTVTIPATGLLGDVDDDGSVGVSDASALIDYLLYGDASTINLANADCDQDGFVTISDASALIDYLLHGVW